MSLGGVVGAAIGFYLGGPQGAMYGYSIGSAAEGYLNPQTVQGPRLNDLTTQMSVYGAPIPFEWGLNRHAGTIIWPQTLTAVETSHSESAKGGPEQETFTYALTYAVLICEGPIVGVRRAWRNKKLVYDVSVENTGATLDTAAGTLRFYLGTEDQEVDPLIFATDGPSPAYLGWAYVVIEGEDVTEMGGRPSQWEFEVMSVGSSAPNDPPESIGDGGLVAMYMAGTDDAQLWTVNNTTNAYCYDPVTGDLLATVVLPYVASSVTVGGGLIWVGYSESGFGTTACASGINPTTFAITVNTKFGYGGAVSTLGTVVWNEAKGLLYGGVNGGIGAGLLFFNPSTLATGTSGVTAPDYVYYSVEMPDIFRIAVAGRGNWLVVADTNAGASGSSLATVTNSAWSSTLQGHRIQYDAIRHCLYWSGIAEDGIYKVDLTTYALTLHISVTAPDGMHYSPETDIIYVDDSVSGDLGLYDPDDGSLILNYPGYGVLTGSTRGSSADGANGEYYFVAEVGLVTPPGALYKVMIGGRLLPDQVLHSTIVSDICVKSDLLTTDINVTALTDLVDGYKVANQMTGRAAIEPTLQAYNAAAVESDHKIKFVKLGGAIAATIPASDRATHEFGSAIPDSLSITRAFELEIPNECDIEYIDVNADHLTGNQYARRLVKETKQKINIQMPIVMSGTKAKSIAETALYQGWLNQSFRWTTTRKYAYLEPTDPVYLTTDQATYGVRITKRRDQPNGVIEWEGRMEDPYTYTQTGAGAATVGYLPQTIVTPPDTILALMDCAMLRDEDDNAGFYVAMGGEL